VRDNKLSKEDIGELKNIVKRGKWNYILTCGCKYGLLMFVFVWILTEFILNEEFYVVINLILWGIGGFVYGLLSWNNINKKIKEAKK
jgi:hypothetical protein